MQIIIDLDNYEGFFIVVDVDKDGEKKVLVDNCNHLIGICMANNNKRPIAVSTFIKNYEQLVYKQDKKLLDKLYKLAYIDHSDYQADNY